MTEASPPPPWLSRALLAVARRFDAIEPPLSERLAQITDRLSRMNGGRSLGASLCADASTPFVRLVDAYREDIGMDPDDARVDAVGEGTLLLYFCVRAQDDIVDEPALVGREDVYAMEVLSGASARAFASAVQDGAGFFAFREEVMRAFASVAAWEASVYRRGDRGAPATWPAGDLGWLGRKFLPMAVPLGALAFAAERAADLDRLTHLVTCLGSGLQMVNDVLNAGEDHAAGRPTPVLASLYEGGRVGPEDSPTRVRMLLLSDAALDRALEHASRHFVMAEEAAIGMGARATAAVARERAAFVETVPGRLFALALGAGELR